MFCEGEKGENVKWEKEKVEKNVVFHCLVGVKR